VSDVTVSWLAYSVNPDSPYRGCINSMAQPCMATAPNFLVSSGKGPRDFVQKITWPEFRDVPAVATWLSGFEIYTNTDVRLKAVEKARTRNGCDLIFGTWDNTIVGGGDITWFAFLDSAPSAAGAAGPAGVEQGMRDSNGRRFVMSPPPAAAAPAPASSMPMAPPMGAPAGGLAPPPGPADSEAGLECIVCFERPKDTLLQPCNHICCCSTCAAKLSPNICPVCRSAIESKVKIFFT